MKRTKIINEAVQEMQTWEYEFSKVMTEQAILAICELYEKIGAEVEEVIEYCRTHEDIKEHIDAKFITTKDGILREHTWQIKVLNKWNYRENFTIEFCQDRYRRVLGEVTEIKAKFYFHGYFNAEDNYIDYHVINVEPFKQWFFSDLKERLHRERSAGGSRASFFYIPYKSLSKTIMAGKGKYQIESKQELAA